MIAGISASTDWNRIDLRHLGALAAVAEARSVSRAAERLGYTQSAVSQQIRSLERIVGVELLVRAPGARHVELTDAGQVGGVGAHVTVRGDEALADGGGVGEQAVAGTRQLDGARAGRSHEQLDADDALQRADLLADRRLRVAEPLCRATHRARLGDGGEGSEVAQVDPVPVSRRADARDDSPTCSAWRARRCSRGCASS